MPITLPCIGIRKSLIESITKAYIPQDELSHIYPASSDVPRICGSWVGVLSVLAENPSTRFDSVLSPAVTALNSCITSKTYAQSVQDYAFAVDVLRSDTQQLKSLDAEFAAAIMCLALAEVWLPILFEAKLTFGSSCFVIPDLVLLCMLMVWHSCSKPADQICSSRELYKACSWASGLSSYVLSSNDTGCF